MANEKTVLSKAADDEAYLKARQDARIKIEEELRSELMPIIRKEITAELTAKIIADEHQRQQQTVLATLNGMAPTLRLILNVGNTKIAANTEFGEVAKNHPLACLTDDGNDITFMGIVATIGNCIFGRRFLGTLLPNGRFGGWKLAESRTTQKKYTPRPEDVVAR